MYTDQSTKVVLHGGLAFIAAGDLLVRAHLLQSADRPVTFERQYNCLILPRQSAED